MTYLPDLPLPLQQPEGYVRSQLILDILLHIRNLPTNRGPIPTVSTYVSTRTSQLADIQRRVEEATKDLSENGLKFLITDLMRELKAGADHNQTELNNLAVQFGERINWQTKLLEQLVKIITVLASAALAAEEGLERRDLEQKLKHLQQQIDDLSPDLTRELATDNPPGINGNGTDGQELPEHR